MFPVEVRRLEGEFVRQPLAARAPVAVAAAVHVSGGLGGVVNIQTFSKVSSTGSLYSQYTRALTFENFLRRMARISCCCLNLLRSRKAARRGEGQESAAGLELGRLQVRNIFKK